MVNLIPFVTVFMLFLTHFLALVHCMCVCTLPVIIALQVLHTLHPKQGVDPMNGDILCRSVVGTVHAVCMTPC